MRLLNRFEDDVIDKANSARFPFSIQLKWMEGMKTLGWREAIQLAHVLHISDGYGSAAWWRGCQENQKKKAALSVVSLIRYIFFFRPCDLTGRCAMRLYLRLDVDTLYVQTYSVRYLRIRSKFILFLSSELSTCLSHCGCQREFVPRVFTLTPSLLVSWMHKDMAAVSVYTRSLPLACKKERKKEEAVCVCYRLVCNEMDVGKGGHFQWKHC